MQNPFWVEDVGTFIVKTYEVDGSELYQIDEGNFINVYTPLAGAISENLSVTMTDTTTFTTDVTYYVSFTPKHYIPMSGLLVVTVPD